MTESPSFLVINVSRIGDTLLAIPAIRAIAAAYPQAAITVLGHRKRAEVLCGLPFITEVGSISKKTAPWRGRFKDRRYTHALVYGFDKPLVHYALRVADRVIAFRQDDVTLDRRLYRCVELPLYRSEHAVWQLLRLPRAINIAPAGLRIAYQVLPAEALVARKRLAADVPVDASPLIGLQVASFPTRPYRDWPIKQFEGLARRVREQWPASHFLLYGGTDDRARTLWLKNQLGSGATDYAGLSLRETAAVMNFTDLYIGVDTGPTHLMSAFDIPLIGLYHCLSSKHLIGPLEHPCLYAIEHPRPVKDCTEQSPMDEITVETVFTTVARTLNDHPPKRRLRNSA